MKPRRAKCIEIWEPTGAQCYLVDCERGYEDVWLCGIDKALGVKVGDKGVLEYIGTATNGFYRFTKDKAREGKE